LTIVAAQAAGRFVPRWQSERRNAIYLTGDGRITTMQRFRRIRIDIRLDGRFAATDRGLLM
jgi:hypothetical protein